MSEVCPKCGKAMKLEEVGGQSFYECTNAAVCDGRRLVGGVDLMPAKKRGRPSKLALVGEASARPDPAEVRCNRPKCLKTRAPGRSWCQEHIDQWAKYKRPTKQANRGAKKTTRGSMRKPKRRVVAASAPPREVVPDLPLTHTSGTAGRLAPPAPQKTGAILELNAEIHDLQADLTKLISARDVLLKRHAS